MRVLVALLVVACVSAVPDECEWGESYWCSSLKTAKLCGAVQHCISTVWSHNTNYKDDASDVCLYCENFIGDVKKFVADKATESAVQAQLDAACNIIPDSQLASQCKEYVDNNLPEIFQMIEAQLDPKAICAALGLCSGFQDKLDHAKISQDLHRVPLKQDKTKVVPILINDYKVTGDVCADCKKLIADVAALITNDTTEAQVEQLIKQNICENLGPFEDQCNTLVDQYTPELLQMLAAQVDPELTCGVLGFCQGGDKSLLMKMKMKKTSLYQAATARVKAGEYCTLCEMVVTELQSLDRDAKVQSEIEQFLKDKLCASLGDLQKQCAETINQYGQLFFELLASELDPTTDCKAIGLCSSLERNDAKIQMAEKVRLALLPMKDFGQLPAGKVPVPAVKQPRVKQSAQCVVCEFVMTEIDQMLGDNSTEAEIMGVLEKVCGFMPDTIKEQCKDFVDSYGPAVLALLEQELKPEEVCTALGLCSQKKKTVSKPQPVKAVGGASCGVCETVIQYVDSLLEQNATEAEIEGALEKVCNFLPASITPECDDLIKMYMPTLLKLLEQELTPSQVCTELGLCSNVKMTPMVKIVPAHAQMVGTNECTYGPSYWCVSRENAKKCGTESHCEKHGWAKGVN